MGRKYPGITVRGNSIQISFMLRGERIRETIRCHRAPTPADLRKAWQVRSAALRDIDLGRFRHKDHFPNSRHAKSDDATAKTVQDAIDSWFALNEHSWAYSTKRDYISAIKTHLQPNFGDIPIRQFDPQLVIAWINSTEISPKRVNNVLVPLRMAFKNCMREGSIDRDPLARVPYLPHEAREPEPFSQNEVNRLLSAAEGADQNLIRFCLNTGLRTSELIALDWQDYDPSKEHISVTKAVVRGRTKTPKTRAGRRFVELCSEASDALKAQLLLTGPTGPVFVDPISGTSWKSDQPLRRRVWIPVVDRAGIRYREQYQMRHTYASRELSAGKNPLWVAKQLGHADWGMIRKVYGRWLPRE